ncbi:MAG: hypothetical protein C3F11_13985 [Methylocystaceae bacterium]|nr:MAG: hypothetical protein C3F11_13985 [Methylocystaceae bacterium]
MPRHNKTGRSKTEGHFVIVPESMTQTAAWRGLSGTAVKAWVDINLVYNGSNNGALGISSRALGERIGVHFTTAAAALLELENAGFLRRTKASSYSQKRLAAEYRLTHKRDDRTGDPPSNEFKRPRVVDNVVSLPAKGA